MRGVFWRLFNLSSRPSKYRSHNDAFVTSRVISSTALQYNELMQSLTEGGSAEVAARRYLCAPIGQSFLQVYISVRHLYCRQKIFLSAWKPHEAAMHFHLFADLPPEIRSQIWCCTLPHPRHVGPLIPSQGLNMRKRRGPSQEDPVALRVNRESRTIALMHYTRRDPFPLKHWELRDNVKYCSYVDFKVDMAFFYDFELFTAPSSLDDDVGSHFFSQQELGRVERLWIVHDGIVNLGRDLTRWLDCWLPSFTRLREMVVEVKMLKNCRGIVALGGGFWTVEEMLLSARVMGVERLYRYREKMEERGFRWELPLLEVEDGENSVFKRRLGG